jgi:ComF family protein
MKEVFEKILDLFFPKVCILCHKEGSYLCENCFFDLKIFSSPFCPYCQKRKADGKICPQCKIYLSGFVAATNYQFEGIKKIIETFKYQFVKSLAPYLASLILKFLTQNPEIEFFKNPTDFILTPVPLHKRRLRWRGFNQSEEIAKILSLKLKIPLKNNLLFREKLNLPQVKVKGKKERKENIKNAFQINPKFEKFIQDKKIILVDDVATTLSTLEEAARTLKKYRTKEIWGLVVAKE